MMPVEVNIVSVLIAAVAAMVVGFIWYSPSVFGAQWTKLTGMKMEDENNKDMPKTYIIMFGLSVVTAYVMAYTLSFMQPTTTFLAAQTGFWMWLGFAMPTTATKMLFSKNKKMKLFLIDTGYTLLAFITIAVVLMLWS